MKNDHRFHLIIVASLALALAAPVALAATKSHATPKAKAAEPAKPAGQIVEYAELENRVGETVSIETTFKTMRTGKLVKYTKPALTLQIGSEDKALELTVPKETIKTITVLPPASADATNTGTSGAKKN